MSGTQFDPKERNAAALVPCLDCGELFAIANIDCPACGSRDSWNCYGDEGQVWMIRELRRIRFELERLTGRKS